MVFVYDFHPGAETMMNRHFGSSSARSRDEAGAFSSQATYRTAGLLPSVLSLSLSLFPPLSLSLCVCLSVLQRKQWPLFNHTESRKSTAAFVILPTKLMTMALSSMNILSSSSSSSCQRAHSLFPITILIHFISRCQSRSPSPNFSLHLIHKSFPPHTVRLPL